MKLYKQHEGSIFDKSKYLGKEATLSDLRAALAEYGMVPVERVDPHDRDFAVELMKNYSKALITAAQEQK